MTQYLLAIDQGTTNSRAILFDLKGNVVNQYNLPLKQYFKNEGWVEQDPLEIFSNVVTCCEHLFKAYDPQDIAAIGITNQRETTIIWDKNTGEPIYPAIVWQDRRTASICEELKQSPLAKTITQKTGLLIDPYFSATKIMWLLDHVEHARTRSENGELLFGTVDSYLLWRLTKGKVHATDATNASRTMLYNLHTNTWDDEILAALNISHKLLPKIMDNTADFGVTTLFGAPIKIAAMAGDQQAATIGQACFDKGMVKMTYGTGGFMMLNTGNTPVYSQHNLLATLLYRINGKSIYALEGSIFSTGSTIKWLRDNLQLIKTAKETENLAAAIVSTEGVYFVPAFTGLGAPYWQPDARAAILGLSSNTGISHIVRAALESIAYQTKDLLHALELDCNMSFNILRVDGGMSENNWLLQFLANILHLRVERPDCIETTALGVAYLAGLQVGVFKSLDEIATLWGKNRDFLPENKDENLYAGWKNAVARVI